MHSSEERKTGQAVDQLRLTGHGPGEEVQEGGGGAGITRVTQPGLGVTRTEAGGQPGPAPTRGPLPCPLSPDRKPAPEQALPCTLGGEGGGFDHQPWQ